MMSRAIAVISFLLVLAGNSVAQDRKTFTVGSATAARGQKATGTIEVPAGVDAALSIPVAVVNGAKPGPVLALVAGSHGTEYTSIIALEKMIGLLNPAEISGTVIIVPLINIQSFEQKVPHVNPVDKKSMNRFYPGKMDGHPNRPRFLSDYQTSRRAMRSLDRFARRRSGREPAALQLLDEDRKRKAGSDLARNGPGVRARSHNHLSRPAERSAGFALPGKHCDNSRQTINHCRSRSRGHG
jgi:hypothetical protein